MSQGRTIELVPLDQIVPLPGNVTVIGREEDLMLRTDMTRIESEGLYKIDPILLRRLTPEEIEEVKAKKPWSQALFQICDGHSRWEAARELGWRQIRAIIIGATREDAYAINYMKNKARGTVDPLREAFYFRHLYEDQKLTLDQIAEKFGITHQRVSQILKRIKISEDASRVIATRVAMGEKVSGKHLETIASLPEPDKQVQLTQIVVDEKLSWRQAEEAKKAIEKGLPKEEVVKKAKAPPPSKPSPIDTGKIFECDICRETYTIIHVDQDKHRFQKITVMESQS